MADFLKTVPDLLGLGSSKTGDNKLKGSIQIYCFSTDKKVIFDNVYNANYSESYNLSWSPNEVYGRMDPIATYRNTKRKINLNFDLLSIGKGETTNNSINMDILRRSLYPVYSDGLKGTAVISSPPMFRVKWNIIISNDVNSVENGNTLKGGVLCYMDNFDIKPSILQGGGWQSVGGYLVPKNFNVSLGLNIIHEYPLGTVNNSGKIVPRIQFGSTPKPTTALPTVGGAPLAADSLGFFISPSDVVPYAPANTIQQLVADSQTSSVQAETAEERYKNSNIEPFQVGNLNDAQNITDTVNSIIENVKDGNIKWILSLKNTKDKKIYDRFYKQLIAQAGKSDNYKGVKF